MKKTFLSALYPHPSVGIPTVRTKPLALNFSFNSAAASSPWSCFIRIHWTFLSRTGFSDIIFGNAPRQSATIAVNFSPTVCSQACKECFRTSHGSNSSSPSLIDWFVVIVVAVWLLQLRLERIPGAKRIDMRGNSLFVKKCPGSPKTSGKGSIPKCKVGSCRTRSRTKATAPEPTPSSNTHDSPGIVQVRSCIVYSYLDKTLLFTAAGANRHLIE
mmetsp:Transcript_2513/g.3482  ORF Transcript_2513/g.3482 Transcript_2513/m.3482 type:complete len:215 (-) Transcript_2513:182-826(-)